MITVSQLETRLGPDFNLNSAQATALIEDATALIRHAAPGLALVDVAPAVIVPVMVSMIRRAIVNPDGASSQSIDDHSVSHTKTSGLFMTADEKRIVGSVRGPSFRSVPLYSLLPEWRWH